MGASTWRHMGCFDTTSQAASVKAMICSFLNANIPPPSYWALHSFGLNKWDKNNWHKLSMLFPPYPLLYIKLPSSLSKLIILIFLSFPPSETIAFLSGHPVFYETDVRGGVADLVELSMGDKGLWLPSAVSIFWSFFFLSPGAAVVPPNPSIITSIFLNNPAFD